MKEIQFNGHLLFRIDDFTIIDSGITNLKRNTEFYVRTFDPKCEELVSIEEAIFNRLEAIDHEKYRVEFGIGV